jgi:hypothetical protein
MALYALVQAMFSGDLAPSTWLAVPSVCEQNQQYLGV